MDPFLLAGPAIINVSGGRTSAYMLRRILDAHGGVLPENVRAVFCNTGREMEATLRFVQQLSEYWGVHITWLEFTGRRRDGFRVVSHNQAARNGEPFQRLLQNAGMLPNPVARICTAELKVRTVYRWARVELGWKRWKSAIGLRADEPKRLARPPKPGQPDTRMTPLAAAGITEEMVRQFWRTQPFDLQLRGRWEGNCDGCFLKSRAAIERMMANYPDRMRWWAEMEQAEARAQSGAGAYFRKDRPSYQEIGEQLQRRLKHAPRLPLDETMIDGATAGIMERCDWGCGA